MPPASEEGMRGVPFASRVGSAKHQRVQGRVRDALVGIGQRGPKRRLSCRQLVRKDACGVLLLPRIDDPLAPKEPPVDPLGVGPRQVVAAAGKVAGVPPPRTVVRGTTEGSVSFACSFPLMTKTIWILSNVKYCSLCTKVLSPFTSNSVKLKCNVLQLSTNNWSTILQSTVLQLCCAADCSNSGK
jgi:hypothetical protein